MTPRSIAEIREDLTNRRLHFESMLSPLKGPSVGQQPHDPVPSLFIHLSGMLSVVQELIEARMTEIEQRLTMLESRLPR